MSFRKHDYSHPLNEQLSASHTVSGSPNMNLFMSDVRVFLPSNSINEQTVTFSAILAVEPASRRKGCSKDSHPITETESISEEINTFVS